MYLKIVMLTCPSFFFKEANLFVSVVILYPCEEAKSQEFYADDFLAVEVT